MSKISLKNNYYFYFLLIIALFLSSIISYENISFDLYFNNKYKDYSDYFKGLLMGKSVLEYNELSTFPIWGYGLIHLLFKSKLNILIVQQLLNLIAIVKVDQFLIEVKKIKHIKLSRILLLLSLPYFFFHTQMWPKSISSSLLILGVLQIFYYLENNKILNLVFAGILLGLLSNFRSDYLFFIFILPLFLLFSEFYQTKTLKFYSLKVLIIPGLVILFLIPWSNYTYSKTNHYLLNSTNTGHTLFIGLGQLPENYWGITPRDDDSKMNEVLMSEFKQKKIVSSVSYSANQFLKNKFLEQIIDNPLEWTKKCLYSLRLILLDPFYVGNVGDFQKNGIANILEIRALENAVYRFNFSAFYEILMNTDWLFSSKEIFQILVTILTKLIGLIIFFSTLSITLYTILKSSKTILNDPTLSLSYLLLSYQISISVFAFHMPVYNTSIYLIYLIILILNKLLFNQTVNGN